uniref:Uncharacterized protein n=1 Tax=viral metagenome TaxID=1070528 RepID=A0A6C0ABW4_9ZZZZ
MTILNLVNNQEIIDLGLNIDLLKKYIKNYFENSSIKKFIDSNEINLIIPYELSELWIKDSIKGKISGRGNGSFDVIKDNIGIEIACMNFNATKTSNEKSIIQIFNSDDLDKLFEQNKEMEIMNIFKQAITKKYNNKIEKIYYIFLLTSLKNIYLTIFKFDKTKIIDLKSNKFLKKSLIIDGFINKEEGTTKIYKSKKRFEIRLRNNILNRSLILY